jgi:hypothetical protein
MIKLSDTQAILLSGASQCGAGSLLPLPASLANKAAAVKAITALIGCGLVEERETAETGRVHRQEGDLRYGVFITVAGMIAIGVYDDNGEPAEPPATTPAAAAPRPERASKTSAVIALLTRGEGATLSEMIAATGWLPHTTRAALTGLRKKGHAIERGKRDGATCYNITAAA